MGIAEEKQGNGSVLEMSAEDVSNILMRDTGHDIHNVAVSIKFLMEIYQKTVLDGNPSEDDHSRMVENLRRLSIEVQSICNRLYGFNPTGLICNWQRWSLRKIIKGAALNAGLFNYPHVRLKVRGSKPAIVTDSFLLDVALRQFFKNSLAAERNGSLCITVEVKNSNTKVMITIADDGCGIPPPVLKRIKKFGGSYGKPGHTGQGMKLANDIMKILGGKMSISSQEGKGTCVKLFLPKDRNACSS